MTSLDELKRRFASADFLAFSEKAPGFIAIEVKTAFSTATIALQGAHVMTWQPKGQKPVIWLSSQAKFAPGKSIRGGVPLCWPWFGQHATAATEAGYPGHGFARTIPWTLFDARQLPDDRVRLEFKPEMNDAALAQWPHASTVRYNVTVGQELVVGLVTRNTGSVPFQLGQALHTYFTVGDIRQASIAGLEGCTYSDKVAGAARKKQKGAVTFKGEMDRVYLGTSGCCGIIDPVLKRTILITSTGSRSTVVWNPGAEKATKMGDFGRQGENKMVCVETANAADDVITLAPGETHRMTAQYRTIKL
ncbi:MAG: D-hexose-6-phosphate mutarotase [Rhodocyclaceae bacterium]|nr:D-hexose-6-phosphate mutarotase [Rhodocyclaceae bacterium]